MICTYKYISFHCSRHVTHCVESVQIRYVFWSVFSRIRTEYGDLLRKSCIQSKYGKTWTWKKLCIWTFFMQWLTTISSNSSLEMNPAQDTFQKILSLFRTNKQRSQTQDLNIYMLRLTNVNYQNASEFR